MKLLAALAVVAVAAFGVYAIDEPDGCPSSGICTEADVEGVEDSVDEVMLLQMQPGASLQEQLLRTTAQATNALADVALEESILPSVLERQNDTAGESKDTAITSELIDISLVEAVTPDAASNTSVVEAASEDATSNMSMVELASEDDAPHTWGWSPQGCSGLLCMGNCPITANPTNDGGCCSAGTFGTGAKSCVTINSKNLLKYSCGLSGTASCDNDASFFSNKDEKEVCSLDGQSCTFIKYGWWTRHLNLFGGDRQDKLDCTCGEFAVFRRAEDGPWVQGR